MKLFYYHGFLAYFEKRAHDKEIFKDLTEKKAIKFLKRIMKKMSRKAFKFDKNESLYT